MNQTAIRVKNNANVHILAEEISKLISSGQVVSLKVISKTTNFLAIQAITEALRHMSSLGYVIETVPEFERFSITENNPVSEKKTRIRWTVKLKEKI